MAKLVFRKSIRRVMIQKILLRNFQRALCFFILYVVELYTGADGVRATSRGPVVAARDTHT